MASNEIPPDVVELADRRAAARRAGDWSAADALRDQIAAAGWAVVDAGTLYTLERAAAPNVTEGSIIRYGSSRSVPSRLEDAPAGVASVVLLATDWPEDLARTLRSLVDHAPDGTQLVVVANAPSEAQASRLDELDQVDPGAPGIVTEVVWTSTRLGHAAALNAGIRRAAADVLVLMDTSIEADGDLVGTLVHALGDPTVAVAGPFGLMSPDLRHFQQAEGDVTDVVAIEGVAMAFRRSDYVERGPLDEHFVWYPNLDIWWSLVLRDQVAAGADVPRRAVRVTGAAAGRHEHRGRTSVPDSDRERLARRNLYRVLKRFATRRDLLVGART